MRYFLLSLSCAYNTTDRRVESSYMHVFLVIFHFGKKELSSRERNPGSTRYKNKADSGDE